MHVMQRSSTGLCGQGPATLNSETSFCDSNSISTLIYPWSSATPLWQIAAVTLTKLEEKSSKYLSPDQPINVHWPWRAALRGISCLSYADGATVCARPWGKLTMGS